MKIAKYSIKEAVQAILEIDFRENAALTVSFEKECKTMAFFK